MIAAYVQAKVAALMQDEGRSRARATIGAAKDDIR